MRDARRDHMRAAVQLTLASHALRARGITHVLPLVGGWIGPWGARTQRGDLLLFSTTVVRGRTDPLGKRA